MTVRKLFDKFQDKISPPSSVKPSSTTRQQQERSFEERRFTALSKWRGKWGGSKSCLFSNKKKDQYHITDISCPSSLHEPTITMSSSTIHQRPYSAIDHVSHFTHSHHQQQQQRPSTTQTSNHRQQSRLSVPHVIDQLRSKSHGTLDAYSSDDTGSFYNAPLSSSPPPAPAPRRFTWYHPSSHNNQEEGHMNDDDEDIATTDSVSSSWVSKHNNNNDDLITHKSPSPVSIASQEPVSSSSITNETLQQHKSGGGDSTSHDDDHPPAAMPCQDILEKRRHYQLAMMNVANTVMTMREKQLELQMATLTIKNQQLEQQMRDVVNGTWTSTSQLIEENDRLEAQIRQLQQQQQRRVKPPSSLHGTGGGESGWQDEQEALRHTRAQLGLVEYLEGEPDVMAALNRFKKLLTSSC